jgi:DNA invertase Pin-like site-specific DNA recombinase
MLTTRIITPDSLAREPFCSILTLPDAQARFGTDRVVYGVRVSEQSQIEKGSLERQLQSLRAAIREAGGMPVAITGYDGPQDGLLSSGRPDLLKGCAQAERHKAILCYIDLRRLFRPAAFHGQNNLFAPYTVEDFAKLYEIVGDSPLAVIVPPDKTVEELHSLATLRGLEPARLQVRRPGPKPQAVTPRVARAIIDLRSIGMSLAEIAEIVGMEKLQVDRFLKREANRQGEKP